MSTRKVSSVNGGLNLIKIKFNKQGNFFQIRKIPLVGQTRQAKIIILTAGKFGQYPGLTAETIPITYFIYFLGIQCIHFL